MIKIAGTAAAAVGLAGLGYYLYNRAPPATIPAAGGGQLPLRDPKADLQLTLALLAVQEQKRGASIDTIALTKAMAAIDDRKGAADAVVAVAELAKTYSVSLTGVRSGSVLLEFQASSKEEWVKFTTKVISTLRKDYPGISLVVFWEDNSSYAALDSRLKALEARARTEDQARALDNSSAKSSVQELHQLKRELKLQNVVQQQTEGEGSAAACGTPQKTDGGAAAAAAAATPYRYGAPASPALPAAPSGIAHPNKDAIMTYLIKHQDLQNRLVTARVWKERVEAEVPLTHKLFSEKTMREYLDNARTSGTDSASSV